MATYTPENNPYIPGDPYSYDLKWMVEETKKAQTSGAQAAASAEAAAASAEAAGASADSAATNASNALIFSQNAEASAESAAGSAADAAEVVAPVIQALNTQGQQISALEGRMDTFTSLTEGSTTGDAELQDIRVAADGTVYPTAGDAVRGQINGVNADLATLGEGWQNIAYSNASMLNTPYTASSANETYNGPQIPFTFTQDNFYLLVYKLKITAPFNSAAGNIRPTLIGYDGGFRRMPYVATNHNWLAPANYAVGSEVILWDVVRSDYSSNKYMVALICPSNTSPFTQNSTGIEYSSIAIIPVTTIEEGEALAPKMIEDFTFKARYFFPDVTLEVVESIFNKNALNGFNAFSRFCVVGDSLSVGFYTDSNNAQHFSDYAHSWPYYIEKLFGAKAYWAGYSGATCKTWLEQTSGTWGLTYTRSLGAMPLYFLCMGANEYGTTIGTIADINSDDPTTLYGYVGKTIRELKAISPKAYIICTGVSRGQETASTINAVYEAVCAQFDNCYYYDVQSILQSTYFTECFYNSHYCALGYERMAKLYNWCVEKIIDVNAVAFRYINEADITAQPK